MHPNLDQPESSRHDQICVTIIVMQTEARAIAIAKATTVSGTAGAIGLAALMWVADHLHWYIPIPIYWVIALISAAVIVWSTVLWVRILITHFKDRKLDPFLAIALVALFVALVALGIFAARSMPQIAADPQIGSEQGAIATARIRLRFIPGVAVPEIIRSENILKPHSLAFVDSGDPAPNSIESRHLKWRILFLVFENLLAASQLRIHFEGSGAMPTYEIRAFTPRSAVIEFGGAFEDKIVDIEAYD